MATRPEDLQNWSLWDFDENPHLKLKLVIRLMDTNGAVFMFVGLEQNNQTGYYSMTEDGQLILINDDTITIIWW